MPQGFPEDPIAGVQARRVRRTVLGGRLQARWPTCAASTAIIFGSDWPHPEGLADPINLVDDLARNGLDEEGMRKVMGGNMIDLFKVPNKNVHKPDVPALVLA